MPNKSMDVRVKPRLSCQWVFLTPRLRVAVSPRVNTAVMPLFLKSEIDFWYD